MDAINTNNAVPNYYSDASRLSELTHDQRLTQQQKVAEVSKQFESILLRQFLSESLKPMIEGAVELEGSGHHMYQHMITDQFATAIANSGQMGVSNALAQHIPGGETNSPQAPTPSISSQISAEKK